VVRFRAYRRIGMRDQAMDRLRRIRQILQLWASRQQLGRRGRMGLMHEDRTEQVPVSTVLRRVLDRRAISRQAAS
jgi:hypothetical protein